MKLFVYKCKHILFWLKANNSKGHGTHSPFVYKFITEVLNDKRDFYAFAEIKKQFLQEIQQTKPSLKCYELLFRISHYYRCQSILYIGHHQALQNTYLYGANPTANLYYLNQVDNDLQTLMNDNKKLDLIYVEQNRTTTLNSTSINNFLKAIHLNSIIIVQNIYENEQQMQLWKNLQSLNKIFITVDIFFFGIIFFSENFKQREDFKVRF